MTCQAEDFDGVVLVKDITAEGFLYCLRKLQIGSYYTGGATGTNPSAQLHWSAAQRPQLTQLKSITLP